MGVYLLETAVFFFKSLQAFQLADGEASVPGLPVVVGGITHPVLAAQVCDFGAGFTLAEHGNGLFLDILSGARDGTRIRDSLLGVPDVSGSNGSAVVFFN